MVQWRWLAIARSNGVVIKGLVIQRVNNVLEDIASTPDMSVSTFNRALKKMEELEHSSETNIAVKITKIWYVVKDQSSVYLVPTKFYVRGDYVVSEPRLYKKDMYQLQSEIEFHRKLVKVIP